MIIQSLNVIGLYGHYSFRLKFGRKLTAIVGINGTYKSTICHIITCLTGHPDTNALCSRIFVAKITLVVKDDDGKIKTFDHSGYLTEDVTSAFKNTLISQSSQGCGDYGKRFINQPGMVFNKNDYLKMKYDVYRKMNKYDLMLSDGQRTFMDIILGIPNEQMPYILDCPETSLDISATRILAGKLSGIVNQVIIVTHCPTMLCGLDISGDGQREYDMGELISHK